MDIMGGLTSQIGNWVHDWATSAWKQDKAEGMQDHAQNFAASQQLVAQDFSERMFNNRYSKTVNDLLQSGLNPMLAYGQGGGHAPGSSAASAGGANAPAMTSSGNTLAASIQSAAQARVLDAQARNIDADTAIKQSDFIDREESGEPKLPTTYSARLKSHQGREAWYRAAQLIDQADLTRREELLVKQEIINAETRNELDRLNIPEAINRARAQSSLYMQKIAPYTGELGKLVHSASEAQEAFRGRKTIRSFGR